MYQIKILGTGCPKCKNTVANALEAVKLAGVEATVIKVEDIQDIMAYNVLVTPVLVINEEIKVKGRVPTVEEIKNLLTIQ
jgi:small redox-active disulfide protein 2